MSSTLLHNAKIEHHNLSTTFEHILISPFGIEILHFNPIQIKKEYKSIRILKKFIQEHLPCSDLIPISSKIITKNRETLPKDQQIESFLKERQDQKNIREELPSSTFESMRSLFKVA